MTKRARILQIDTSDGVCPARLFDPGKSGSTTGVIVYMDAFGLRPALDEIAERIAASGHFVIVPDLFYRAGAYEAFDAKTAFSVPETKVRLMNLIQGTSQAMTVADGRFFIDALTAAGATGAIATVGYCIGGARALNAAAAYPERIAAAASFHGGNLAAETSDSPAANAARMRARIYVGVAGVDASFPPEQSARLAKAFREAGVDHIVENYVGMGHGWAVGDHSVYDPAGALRHWRRLATLFEEALGVPP